jgi:hypothetical protein
MNAWQRSVPSFLLANVSFAILWVPSTFLSHLQSLKGFLLVTSLDCAGEETQMVWAERV